jgi:DNA-directed RNA polymerase subunit RPC12/RpoP
MGLGFDVTCPDCGREWNGAETYFRFGPWSLLEYPAIDDGFRSWFCPRCNFRIYIPRTIERSVWHRWYAAFLNGPDGGDPFLRSVGAKLDEVLSDGRYYTPLPVALRPVDCPECQRPFELNGVGALDRLVCPHCGGRGALLVGPKSHCQASRDPHGLS